MRPTSPTPASVARLGLFVRALALAHGSLGAAARFAEAQATRAGGEVATVLRSAVGASTDAEMAGFLQPIAGELVGLVRARSIVGRLAARRIAFHTRTTELAAGFSGSFVPTGQPIPVGRANFGVVADSLAPKRVGALAVVTAEILRADPAISDVAIALDLARAVAAAEDRAFTDSAADGTDGRPAGIANGALALSSSGASLGDVDGDLRAMMTALTDSGEDLASAVWVAHGSAGAFLRSLRGSGGAPAFPLLQSTAPALHSLPFIESPNVPRTVSGPSSSLLLVVGDAVRVADDGDARIETSDRTALEMSDAPTQNAISGEGKQIVSLWQTDSVAMKIERFINWSRARSTAAVVLTGCPY